MCSDITRSHIEEILLFIERAFHKANRRFGPQFERADFSGMDIILLTVRDDAVDDAVYWEADVTEGDRDFACCSPDAGEKTKRF